MRALTLIAMFLLGWQFANAQKTDNLTYAASKKIFETGKAAHNNSYEYSLKFASFAGFWYETTFVVKEGKVVERRFKSDNDYNDDAQFDKNWSETGDQLGSHHSEGHKIMTMDELYADAEKWAKSPKDAYMQHFFETKNKGIISIAGGKVKNCMDDCFQGYRVSSFKWN